MAQRYRAQATDPTRRVRCSARADRIWRIYWVTAHLKSASSLRSLRHSVESSVQYYRKLP